MPILRRNKHKKEAEEFCCRDNRLRNPLAAAACSRALLAKRKSLYPSNRKFSVAEIALQAPPSDTVACSCSMLALHSLLLVAGVTPGSIWGANHE